MKVKAVDLFYFCGALLVSLGVGLFSVGGGLIAAGAFALLASVLLDFGPREPRKPPYRAGDDGDEAGLL